MDAMQILPAKPLAAVCCLILSVGVVESNSHLAVAQVVPGTGEYQPKVSDDFEDENWEFVHNFPKSSSNIDKQTRQPTGSSKNGLWFESMKRGQPDVVKRVPTPPGGLPGSKGALLMQSLHTGVPGWPSRKWQQDDLLVNVSSRLGGHIPVAWSPNVVIRLYIPEFDKWEKRTGASFGFRASVTAHHTVSGSGSRRKGFFRLLSSGRGPRVESEALYPGMFIQFNSKASGYKEDSAHFILRADERGYDYTGPQIKQTGWWTLGMSFTPDGKIHYYARPGVENLSQRDLIGSHFYGDYTCTRLNSYFFDVCSANDGRSWSTPWIIDAPALYFTRR